jgi:hypothetical protein
MLVPQSTINLAPTPARQVDDVLLAKTQHPAFSLHHGYHIVNPAQRDQSYPETLEDNVAVWTSVSLHKLAM